MPAHFHHVPGRLRIHMPSVKGNASHAQAVENRLSRLEGVSHVEGRPLTGSVVIHYDAATVDSDALFTALNLTGDARKLPAKPPGALPARSNGIATKAAKMVAGYALEKAVERGIPLLIGALL